MTTVVTKRLVKGSPLTFQEGDDNLTFFENSVPVSVKNHGAVGDGVADDTAALNAAVAAAISSGVREVHFPEGLWRFASKPAVIPSGVTLVGVGKRNTYLVRDYSEGTATNGFLEWDGSTDSADGGGLRNIILYAGTGTTGGTAIKIAGASSSSRAGHMSFDHVEISGNGTWAYGLYSDGSAITDAGSQGYRDVHFTGLDIFNCTTKSMYLKNAVGWRFLGLGTFAGAGNTPNITIDGGGSETANSTGIHFAGLHHSGDITVQNANEVTFAGARAQNLTIASTGTNVSYIGYLANAPTNNSTQAHVIYTKAGVGAAISGVITALNGITFGAGTDVLSEYDEFSWTPVITFTTPGNLSVVYTAQVGRGIKVGKRVLAEFTISISTFTHTTASGNLVVTGLSHAAAANGTCYGSLARFTGITLANYTQFQPLIVAGDNKLFFAASAQGQVNTLLTVTEVVTTSNPLLHGFITYETAA